MHHYWQGRVHRQAHKGIPKGCYEEEQGRGGFYGPVSHLLKKAPSTRWTNIKGSLKPRLYNLNRLKPGLRHQIFFNPALDISYLKSRAASPRRLKAYRSADGDLIYFCHKGRGELLTEYGLLSFQTGCYIIVPKNMVHSFLILKDCEFLIIQSLAAAVGPPARGLLGRHALYDIQALQKPDLTQQKKRQKQLKLCVKEIEVVKAGAKTVFSYSSDIYDVQGWKGDVFPFVLDIKDIMPVVSPRVHLPPSVHTTFKSPDFVVCTFTPRPLETEKDCLKVPFYHQNIDYDEVLFYHAGAFFSRDDLKSGFMSFHPAGFPHGPHPKAVKASAHKTHTSEYAVMVDSLHPLKVGRALLSVEFKNYWKTWRE